MLEEAMFTMAGFIKGPVCRGQVALNVIEDRFWITFVDPESPIIEHEAELLAKTIDDLRLPAEQGSTNLLLTWRRYAKGQERYLSEKSKYLSALAATPADVGLQHIWDGDGSNSNAGLTVMRHYDSATVVKGLVGGDPKTAWVVGYALLERIHYLLVAGYDVFGNIGHQLHSRLYMDFLRMEGESNFLDLLPSARRGALVDSWYRDTSADVKDHVYGSFAYLKQESGIAYQTAEPEHELYQLLVDHLSGVLEREHTLSTEPSLSLRDQLGKLAMLRGSAPTHMPETSFLEVQLKIGGSAYYTILRDSAHTNVSHLFKEKDRRVPEEDRLTVLRGFVGAYPNSLFSVSEEQLPELVDALASMDSDAGYDALRVRFGIRRTDARFWPYSDRAIAAYGKLEPLESGLFDYNRLDRD
jgi:hypothetical protein